MNPYQFGPQLKIQRKTTQERGRSIIMEDSNIKKTEKKRQGFRAVGSSSRHQLRGQDRLRREGGKKQEFFEGSLDVKLT